MPVVPGQPGLQRITALPHARDSMWLTLSLPGSLASASACRPHDVNRDYLLPLTHPLSPAFPVIAISCRVTETWHKKLFEFCSWLVGSRVHLLQLHELMGLFGGLAILHTPLLEL